MQNSEDTFFSAAVSSVVQKSPSNITFLNVNINYLIFYLAIYKIVYTFASENK